MSDTTETVTYAYAAYKPCGCMVAAATDEPHNADDIAKWIRAGLRVERVTCEAVRHGRWNCQCEKKTQRTL